MPAGLHEGNPLRLGETRMLWRRRRILRNRRLGFLGVFDLGSFDLGSFDLGSFDLGSLELGSFDLRVLQHLIHGFPQSKDQNQGIRNDKQPHLAMRTATDRSLSSGL
jgi:hypothetical protein